VKFQVLGPLRVIGATGDLSIGRKRERLLLGLLLITPGQILPVGRLVESLWDGDGPDSAFDQLRVAASRLRRVLGDVPIVWRTTGYRIEVAPQDVDAARFLADLDSAEQATSPRDRLPHLDRALSRWRGALLADVADDSVRLRFGRGLQEARWSAHERRAMTMLELGMAGRAATELFDVVTEDPTRERLVALLMRALHTAGRSAEAVRVYHDVRARLGADMGIDPGPHLRALLAEILRDTGDEPSPPAATITLRRPAPISQLPADPSTFAGRADALATLDCAMGPRARGTAVTLIVGAGGVGKSALAAHWARTRTDRFPDGQLWVDLRGDQAATALAPDAVLRRLLRGLGVEPDRVPDDLDEAAALYRANLARRRMLVVLDNAHCAGQVRALLPGGDTSAAVVTSRDWLTDLVARYGASRLVLDGLGAVDAIDLLAGIAGEDRISRHRTDSADLVELCGRLPLAICVAAAHLADHPDRTVAAQAAAIRGGVLLRQGADDADPSPVRAVFDQVLASLDDATRHLFLLMGAAPATFFDAHAAARLTGQQPDEARQRMTRLVHAHLVAPTADGRYGMHDLLRAYARDQASELTDEDRQAALGRLYDHYAAAARAAVDASAGRPLNHPELLLGRTSWTPLDASDAAGWLDAEHGNLLAVAADLTGGGPPRHTVALSAILADWLSDKGHTADALTLHRQAITAATAVGDEPRSADARRRLGNIYWLQGRYDDAEAAFEAALSVVERHDDPLRIALTLNSLGGAAILKGDNRAAQDYFSRALRGFQHAGARLNAAHALGNLGSAAWALGEFRQAREYHELSLAIFSELKVDGDVARAYGNLGKVHRQVGAYPESRDCQERALALFRATGYLEGLAQCLADLALACVHLGDLDAASAAIDEGTAISHEIGAQSAESMHHHAHGALHLARSEYGLAAEEFQASQQMGIAPHEATALNGLGTAQLGLGEAAKAISLHRNAYTAAERGQNLYEQARALEGLALALQAAGDTDAAAEVLDHAWAMLERLGVPRSAPLSG
jgi:DNA-binding SARP family transcriptional activator